MTGNNRRHQRYHNPRLLYHVLSIISYALPSTAFPFSLIDIERNPVVNWLFCRTSNTRYCSSSIYPAKKWIRENACSDASGTEDSDRDEPYNELLAVVDLFYSIDFEGSPLEEMNWLSGCNPCLYEGILCDYSNSIDSINLASLGLKGTIPNTIGLLKELEFLDLSGNNFVGTIPSELGALSKLNTLHLEKNELTSFMPSEICELKGWESIFTFITADCGGSTPDVDCSYECCSECYFT